MPVAQVLDELGKVSDVAADAVEAVDHDGGKGDLLGVLHHFLELRALQIAAGKAGCVELLADGDEVDVPVAQVLDELGKVSDVAADAVEAVDHDGGKGDLLGVLHHFLELRALQIAAGKALVLVDQHIFRRILAKVHGDVLTAQLDLVLDALALAGEFGLAGVDNILLRLRLAFRFHSGTSRYSLGW